MLRILFALLLVTEVVHVVDDLLQAADPLIYIFRRFCHQVEILLAPLEDDGEAEVFNAGIGVFFKALRVAALSNRLNVINGDCLESEGVFVRKCGPEKSLKVSVLIASKSIFGKPICILQYSLYQDDPTLLQ